MNNMKLVLLAILLGATMVGCSQTVEKVDSSEVVKAEVDKAAAKESEKVEEPVVEEKKNAKVGETLNVDGVNITVVGISKFEGRINEYEPLVNDHAVQVDVIVENTNKESVYIDSMEFSFYDINGFELAAALPGDVYAISADIPGNKKVKGTLYFDVPVEEGIRELHYTSMASFDGESAIWEVPTE